MNPYSAVNFHCLSPEAVSDLWTHTDKLASEDMCLQHINTFFPSTGEHNPLGRGDDCAILTMPKHMALSTDTFFENSHFRTSYFTPAEVGAKALASAVSDLAAAGAIPLGFSLDLMLPTKMSSETLRDLLQGMAHVADQHTLLLTGGDIAKAPYLGLCVTVWGKSVVPDGDFFLHRARASANDVIFCIGSLGLAKAGLLLLEQGGRAALKDFPLPCQSHLWPRALTPEGEKLACLAFSAPEVHVGLMDVSDGLAQDIPRLLGMAQQRSPLGADITLPAELILPELTRAAKRLGCTPEELILSGGEDYALLGTCPPTFLQKIQEALPMALPIGTITTTGKVQYNGTPLTQHGFDHFRG